MNDFQQKYKSYDTRKLLKILEEAENYQPEAVEAAKFELANREISKADIQSVKNEVSIERFRIEERQKHLQKAEDKAKAIGANLLENISPIQKEPFSADKKLNIIVVVFGIWAVYQLAQGLGILPFSFRSSYGRWDTDPISYFLPLIVLPVALFLFWKRNNVGWMMFCAYLVYNIINALAMLSLAWRWNRHEEISDNTPGYIHIDFHNRDIFAGPDPMTFLSALIVFGGTLWVISRSDSRNLFEINLQTALMTMGAVASISIYLIVFL
ncbi:MAG: hypothetical protein GC192_19715 [Bacteroidetes bacterium]|nr:hypothetical protein [Bacteroidota bacterium]